MTAPPAPGREVEEPLELAADRRDVRSSVSRSSRLRSRRASGRVADHPGPAADDRDRAAAVALEAQQPEDRHEVADVERVGATDRTRCSPRSGARWRAGPARPGVVAWRIPRHSSSARSPSGPACRGRRRHRRGRGRLDDREAAQERSFTAPMLSCGLRCRPPSRGGSAIGARSSAGRRGAAEPSSGRSSSPSHRLPPRHHARWRAPGRCSPWPRTTTTRRACPTRQVALTDLEFEQQTIVYDRTGKVELARLGTLRARSSTFEEHPGRDARRDDRDRGQVLLDQPGLRPGRPSSAPASTRSPAGRAAPRRSPSSSSAPACCRPRRSRARPTSARSARSSSRSG